MGKIIVSKKIFKQLEEVSKFTKDNNTTDYKEIIYLMKTGNLHPEESVKAVKAYLSAEGYEMESTPEEKAIKEYNKYKNCSSMDDFERGWDTGFMKGIKWMDETFNLKLDF